jgi:hypothetical protein
MVAAGLVNSASPIRGIAPPAPAKESLKQAYGEFLIKQTEDNRKYSTVLHCTVLQ